MAAKLFHAIGFRVDIEEVAHPDGRVLVFHIPSRPRGTAYHLDGAYLMRSGKELAPMSEDQLRGGNDSPVVVKKVVITLSEAIGAGDCSA